MRPYIPENHVTMAGAASLAVFSISIGLILGLAGSIVERWIVIWVLLVFFVPSLLFKLLVHNTKVRHPILTPALALLMGFSMTVGLFWTEYSIFRASFIGEIIVMEKVDENGASQLLDDYLAQKTGMDGFPGYLLLVAEEGLEYQSRGSTTAIVGAGVWIVWLVQILVMMVPVFLTGIKKSREPYSISGNDWYPLTCPEIGNADIGQKDALITCLNSQRWLDLPQLFEPEENLSYPMIEVSIQKPPDGGQEVLLHLREVSVGNKSKMNWRDVGSWELSLDETSLLLAEASRLKSIGENQTKFKWQGENDSSASDKSRARFGNFNDLGKEE